MGNPMRKLTTARGRRTNPLIWAAAVLCAALAAATILSALLLLAIYAAYHPHLPSLRISSARLFLLDLSHPSPSLRLALTLTAENRNPRAAAFSRLRMLLRFRGAAMAELRAGGFEVVGNGTRALEYVVEAAGVPVPAAVGEEAERTGKVGGFEVEGKGRARWRVGGLLAVRTWARVRCELDFFAANGSTSSLRCA